MKEPAISVREYLDGIREIYAREGDPLRAEGQMKYMRNKFAYYGLKAPEWVDILRGVFREWGLYSGAQLQTFVRMCYEEEYRELHYAGLQMMEKVIKKQEREFVDFLEECICTESWWDTVDWINKLVGIHFRRFPEIRKDYVRRWIEDDNFWLQRIAIIHQLMYREETDFALLKELILRRADSKEFFVRKAAGWALRQYSRYNPGGVVDFVEAHESVLSSLTRREALRVLKKSGYFD